MSTLAGVEDDLFSAQTALTVVSSRALLAGKEDVWKELDRIHRSLSALRLDLFVVMKALGPDEP